LVLNEDAHKAIQERYASRGRQFTPSDDRQALVPAGARLLHNPVGIAPGFIISEESLFIAVLPGVPTEMKAMYREGLKPALEERFGSRMFITRHVLKTCGLSETAVNLAIQDQLKQQEPMVGLTATESGVDIRIVARSGTAARSHADARCSRSSHTNEARRRSLWRG